MAGSKVDMVKQALVRYIADSNLLPGDKLPSQIELRQMLNVGSATITSAIQLLADDSILRIQDKVGAFVNTQDLDGHTGRTVAILINNSNSIYNHILVSKIQRCLQDYNCTDLIFCAREDKDSKQLENFPGLLRTIREKAISGIIITMELLDSEFEFLDSCGLKYISNLSNDSGHRICYIDHEGYIKDAFAALQRQGARRPVMLANGYRISPPLLNIFRKHFCRTNPDLDFSDYYRSVSGFEQSQDFARELLALPESSRPDSIIYTGDLVMQGVSVWLYRLQEGRAEKYLPPSTVILNKQNPVMPVMENVTVFELDIYEQAERMVEILVEAVRKNRKINSCAVPVREVSLPEYYENSLAKPEIVSEANYFKAGVAI